MKSMTKKITLFFGIMLTLITLLAMEELRVCRLLGVCIKNISDPIEMILFSVSISILPFSLITFWMKEGVFRRWFNFAVWYVPLLVIAMFVFPTSVPGGLGIGGAYQEAFNILVLIILFSIFIIASTVKIVRAYGHSKPH